MKRGFVAAVGILYCRLGMRTVIRDRYDVANLPDKQTARAVAADRRRMVMDDGYLKLSPGGYDDA